MGDLSTAGPPGGEHERPCRLADEAGLVGLVEHRCTGEVESARWQLARAALAEWLDESDVAIGPEVVHAHDAGEPHVLAAPPMARPWIAERFAKIVRKALGGVPFALVACTGRPWSSEDPPSVPAVPAEVQASATRRRSDVQ